MGAESQQCDSGGGALREVMTVAVLPPTNLTSFPESIPKLLHVPTT